MRRWPLALCTWQTNGIFELRVKNDAGKEAVWTIDMKKTGTVYKGPAKPKADVTIILSDETFTQLASGKVCRVNSVGLWENNRHWFLIDWWAKGVYDGQIKDQGQYDVSYKAW